MIRRTGWKQLIEMMVKRNAYILTNGNEFLRCVVVGEPGQQDEGSDHPAAAGSLSHLSVACTETHLLAAGHRLLSPLPPVQHVLLVTPRRWLASCWRDTWTQDSCVQSLCWATHILTPALYLTHSSKTGTYLFFFFKPSYQKDTFPNVLFYFFIRVLVGFELQQSAAEAVYFHHFNMTRETMQLSL